MRKPCSHHVILPRGIVCNRGYLFIHIFSDKRAILKGCGLHTNENEVKATDMLKRMREEPITYVPKPNNTEANRTIAQRMLYHARERAKKAGVPCTITLEDIVIPKRCPLLGVELVASIKQHCANSPSLDRIDPPLGYVKGNIWVISFKANTMKNSATLKELHVLARGLTAMFKEGV